MAVMLRRIGLAVFTAALGLAGIALAPPAQAAACTNNNCGPSVVVEVKTVPDGPYKYGQSVEIRGFVQDDSASCDAGLDGCDDPTGNVFFFLGPESEGYFASVPARTLDGVGVSAFNVFLPSLAPGTHRIGILYHGSGSSIFDDSRNQIDVTIAKGTVAVTLGQANFNPSAFGTPASFPVTVVPDPPVLPDAFKPAGDVILRLPDPTEYARATIDEDTGTATLTSSTLPAGAHTDLRAIYAGDPDGFYDIKASPPISHTVAPGFAGIQTTASPASGAKHGDVVLFTAVLNPSTATGTVVFSDGSEVLSDPIPITDGQAQWSTVVHAGDYFLTANYSGDANFGAYNDVLLYSVDQATPNVGLTAAPNPTVFGQSTLLSATVPSDASGTITFKDGSATIGAPVAIAAGAASTTATLSTGSHTLTAVYSGDNNYTTSTSLPVTQIVNKADSSIGLNGPAGTITWGTAANYTATVAAVAPGAGVPTGTVTFLDGTVEVGTVPLTNGSASFSFEPLPGSHAVSARYNGSGDFNGKSSGALPLTVVCGSDARCVTAPTTSGNVYIGRGERVFIQGTRITGQIIASSPESIVICGSTVNGRVTISGATGPVRIGDPAGGCAGNTIGATTITNSRGGVTIAGNTIKGALACSGNVPAPTNKGQPNSALARSGQCTGL